MWTSDKRLYLDSNGNVVAANHPDKLTLLVREGGQMPMAQAVALGLVANKEAKPEAEVSEEAEAKPKAAKKKTA